VDLALAHTTRTTQQFFAKFWTPSVWLPHLPDLNMLDFSMWRFMQAKVQVMHHANLAARFHQLPQNETS
jgi:hypothetical protein